MTFTSGVVCEIHSDGFRFELPALTFTSGVKFAVVTMTSGLSVTDLYFRCVRFTTVTSGFRRYYESYMGVAVAMSPATYREINGFSNMYWGLGGEDDDLYQRYRCHGYAVLCLRFCCLGYVRVHPRCKNGSCEITRRLFETFGREKSCVIEQEPFLQWANSLLPL